MIRRNWMKIDNNDLPKIAKQSKIKNVTLVLKWILFIYLYFLDDNNDFKKMLEMERELEERARKKQEDALEKRQRVRIIYWWFLRGNRWQRCVASKGDSRRRWSDIGCVGWCGWRRSWSWQEDLRRQCWQQASQTHGTCCCCLHRWEWGLLMLIGVYVYRDGKKDRV